MVLNAILPIINLCNAVCIVHASKDKFHIFTGLLYIDFYLLNWIEDKLSICKSNYVIHDIHVIIFQVLTAVLRRQQILRLDTLDIWISFWEEVGLKLFMATNREDYWRTLKRKRRVSPKETSSRNLLFKHEFPVDIDEMRLTFSKSLHSRKNLLRATCLDIRTFSARESHCTKFSTFKGKDWSKSATEIKQICNLIRWIFQALWYWGLSIHDLNWTFYIVRL